MVEDESACTASGHEAEHATQKPWGWAGSVGAFLAEPRDTWLKALDRHCVSLHGQLTSGSQTEAWRDEWTVTQSALTSLAATMPIERWSIVFEFELPFEGGRRPDAVLLAGQTVIVLEFKQSRLVTGAHLDQVEAYARDLADYHEASHFRRVEPVLVATNEIELDLTRGSVHIAGRGSLAAIIERLSTPGLIDSTAWLDAPYAPLPALVAAARRIFQHERLPHIRRALDERIPERISQVQSLVAEAEATERRRLILITGVPGAGKTLVGLRLVYEHGEGAPKATLLSGNGPLVQVLQSALGSSVFVRDLHKFISSYGTGKRVPTQHVLVFDEAQRAWDRDYMFSKKGIAASEPDMLVEIGARIPTWSVLVGLVGGGQEIYSGEEGGIAQWVEAIGRSPDPSAWEIFCPPLLASAFSDFTVTPLDDLELTASLRSRRADEIHEWVRRVLESDIEGAHLLSHEIQQGSFPLYVTRDLEAARSYLDERYPSQERDARFGLLVSSHAKSLALLDDADFRLATDFMAKKYFKIATWFNAARDSTDSCCALRVAVTEFDCQGLELDLPVVCWGEDAVWSNSGWKYLPKRRQYKLQNPIQLLQNSYRVLLTRGRDGLIIWVPAQLSQLDATYDVLLAAGMRPLPV